MNTKISVIIPIYNTEKFLRRCLDSIVNQTFKDIEIICIDDGSTDNSFSILQEYKQKFSNFVIIQQSNKGAAAARNLGLSLAKGKYVCFFDSDDYFDLKMLETLFFKAEKNNADLVVCSANKVDENGNFIETSNKNWSIIHPNLQIFNQVFSWEKAPENIFEIFSIAPWNKLYLKSMLLENNLYFQELESSNDASFGFIVRFIAKRILITPDTFVNYTADRKNSITENRSISAICIIEAVLKLKEFLQKKGLFNQLEKDFAKGVFNPIMYNLKICKKELRVEFLKKLKEYLPEVWISNNLFFNSYLITHKEFLNFIENKKVMLWGASVFLSEILENKEYNPNILGIIDSNPKRKGESFCGYKIYEPKDLSEIKPEVILLTIVSNNNDIYNSINEFLQNNHKEIKLLPNIFSKNI